MGMTAGHDGMRQDLELRSEHGAFRRANRAEVMPSMHYDEFREAVDGMRIQLNRGESMQIAPRVTTSNLVRVIFASDVQEGTDGHSVRLRMIAADESRPGVVFRLDPNEICLIQKFSGLGEHDVRIDAKWNSELGFLEFKNLRFGSQYVLAFASAGAGELAKNGLPAVPGALSATADLADAALQKPTGTTL
jgi:hypothetical protein